MPENQMHTEILIAGGGMVGAVTACLLAEQGWQVVMIEQTEPEAYAPEQPMDLRVSAISPASVRLLQDAGVWPLLSTMRLRAYRELATWEIPGLETHFHASEVGVPELGFIIENRLIQLACWQKLKSLSNVTILCPAKVQSIQQDEEQVMLTTDQGITIIADWLLATDGATSRVRSMCGIGISSFDYEQDCLLINVDLEIDAPEITWQQFFPTGPRAFLPLAGKKASLVWYDRPSRIQQLKGMNALKLTAEIQKSFPEQLPAFSVTGYGSFPLTRRHAQQYFQRRVILLGDAAHTIHPLAGQGVNLGFKDVAALVDLFAEHQHPSLKRLKQFACLRSRDNQLMQSTMDLFYHGFRSTFLPIKVLRNIGLIAAEQGGWVKRQALRYALGLSN